VAAAGDHDGLHVYAKLDLEHGDGNYVQPPDLLCFLQWWCGKVGKVEASDGGDHDGLFVHPEANLEHEGGSHVWPPRSPTIAASQQWRASTGRFLSVRLLRRPLIRLKRIYNF
jgi:hypothetical protein